MLLSILLKGGLQVRAIWAQTLFDLRRTVRNIRYVIFALAMPIGFYWLYSGMYGSPTRFAGTTWGAYFLISMATFGGIGTTLNITGTQVAVERGQGWQRMLRLTPLAGWQYVASKWLTAMAAALVETTLVTVVARMNGVPVVRLHVLPAALAVWVGCLAFAAIGLWLGQWLDQTSVTYGVTAVYLGMGFLGGLWTPLRFLPSLFHHLAAVMPSYRAAAWGWAILAGHGPAAMTYIVLGAYVIVFGAAGVAWYGRREEQRP
jgi:ABC-2 type transport system permease protein